MLKRLLVLLVSMWCTIQLNLRYWGDWNMFFTLSSAVCFYILVLSVYLQTVMTFKPEKDKLHSFVQLTLSFALCYVIIAVFCYLISTLVSAFAPLPFWVITRFCSCLVILFVDFDIVFEKKHPNYTEYIVATIDNKPVPGKKAPITTPRGTLMVDTIGLTEEEFFDFYNKVKDSYRNQMF